MNEKWKKRSNQHASLPIYAPNGNHLEHVFQKKQLASLQFHIKGLLLKINKGLPTCLECSQRQRCKFGKIKSEKLINQNLRDSFGRYEQLSTPSTSEKDGEEVGERICNSESCRGDQFNTDIGKGNRERYKLIQQGQCFILPTPIKQQSENVVVKGERIRMLQRSDHRCIQPPK